MSNNELVSYLDDLPELLRGDLQTTLATIKEQGLDVTQQMGQTGDAAPRIGLFQALVCSEFFQKHAIKELKTLEAGLLEGPFALLKRQAVSSLSINQALDAMEQEADAQAFLRRLRNQQMMLVAWADLSGEDVEHIIQSLSTLADACIQASVDWAHAEAVKRYGRPLDEAGNEQQLVTVAMGKLGAKELNFSSDVDLIFCYPTVGETEGVTPVSNAEFFLRVCRTVVRLLNKQTQDGFVFRVDTRLRPFGESGALVISFSAMEAYYQGTARQWERYAMIKARLITGRYDDQLILMSMLRSFVYRRYLDYGIFDAIRVMKAQINSQLKQKGHAQNVKLGRGGIREIEFIGQAFQLVRGGRDNALQEPSIVRLLGLLADKDVIEKRASKELLADYRYLRRLENHLQAIADEQTHQLPQDKMRQARLVQSLAFDDWEALCAHTDEVMQRVHRYFETLIEFTGLEGAPEEKHIDCLQRTMDDVKQSLEARFPQDAACLAKTVTDFCQSYNVRRLSDKGQRYLSVLLEKLFDQLQGIEQVERVLDAFLGMLEKICNRTVYLVLLVENSQVLQRLVGLAVASPWVIEQVTKSPILLDELIQEKRLYQPPTREQLRRELEAMLAQIDVADEEQQMETLRVFKQVNAFRVAAADLTDAIPLMIVSDKLTHIAEVIIEQTLALCWRSTVQKYGAPERANTEQASGFAVIAFGKLGGIELGFASDLDLVFLHRTINQDEMTRGPKPIDLGVFYIRLTRKIISFLTTRTFYGPLYEIDLRLRPNGNSGLLVSSLSAFEAYQLSQAWTWEQQALVRARAVAGCGLVIAAFDKIREKSLVRKRDKPTLRDEVLQMREKMRAALLKKDVVSFDLKQGEGGIVDIEFIVQFGVLAFASQKRQVTRFTDNVRLIEVLERISFLSAEQAQKLTVAYKAYREASHHAVLAGKEPLATSEHSDEFDDYVQQVKLIWADIFTE